VRLLCLITAVLLSPWLHAAPQRVVSLDLCVDWMVAYYLPVERVAALSQMQARYPVEWIGPDWPSHDGSLEQVYALHADRIVVGEFAAAQLRRRLQSLGQPLEVLPLPQTLADVAGYQRQFLRAVGLPETLASELPADVAGATDGPRLLLLDANGIGTGSGTLEHEILSRAGWRNYLRLPGYQRLDLEQIILDPPDAILWSAPEHRALANQFAEHAALRRAIPATRWLTSDSWRWQCPGPWTWELIGQLQKWLD
jgi:iron complex transport system substrate-binding protein